LTRTCYEASAAEEEDQRRRRGRGDSAKDGEEPEVEGTQRRLLWMTSRSMSSGPFVVANAADRPVVVSAF
jgi:hypothetical protein